MKKVICTNPDRCHMCMDPPDRSPPAPQLVRGRAYTVLREVKSNNGRYGFVLKEARLLIPPMGEWVHCAPHFEEIVAADEDIFRLADAPIRTRVQEKEDA